MKFIPRFLASIILASLVSCETVEITTYHPTGKKSAKVGIRGNVNLAGVGETNDANNIGGLGILNGGSSGVDQVRRTATEPVGAALSDRYPTLSYTDPLGQKLEIFATIDQASVVRERWIGLRGLAKSAVTGALGAIGLKGHYDTKQAEVAADRAVALGAQGVETEGLRQATAQASIGSDERVAIETLQTQ